MALLADIARIHVSCSFACRRRDIMTGVACPACLAVIEGCNLPRVCRMTVIAGVRAVNVGRVLPRCCSTIMTTGTRAVYCIVIDFCGRVPCCRRVTLLALVF